MEDYIVSVVNGSRDATILGEGPHWNGETNDLLYVDIIGQAIYRINTVTGETGKLLLEDGKVSLIIPLANLPNKYLITVGRDIRILEWDGVSTRPTSLKTIYTVDEDFPLNVFNDGKCDKLGRLWAGTMGDSGPGHMEKQMGSLFSFDLDGNVVKHLEKIDISNGLGWTNDDKIVYHIDTLTYGVDAYDFDLLTGKLCNKRQIFDCKANDIEGIPDGMTIDTNGNLWIAMFGGSSVINVDPRSGKKLGQIKLPTPIPTSVCFGGPNLDILYVTTAKVTLSEEQIQKDPTAGHLYQVTNTGSRGLPAFTYKGPV